MNNFRIVKILLLLRVLNFLVVQSLVVTAVSLLSLML
jgi:hypothetical protein